MGIGRTKPLLAAALSLVLVSTGCTQHRHHAAVAPSSAPRPGGPRIAVTQPVGVAQVFLGRCYYPGDKLTTEPSHYEYGCDASGVLTKMTWTSWTMNGADGTGLSTERCVPACAGSPRVTAHVLVHLSDPVRAPHAKCTNGALFYKTMTIAYPNGYPSFHGRVTDHYKGFPAVVYRDIPVVSC